MTYEQQSIELQDVIFNGKEQLPKMINPDTYLAEKDTRVVQITYSKS